jgi:hypothetical protein
MAERDLREDEGEETKIQDWFFKTHTPADMSVQVFCLSC